MVPPDRAAFHAALARIPPGGVGLLPWQTLVPSPDGPAADPPRSLTYRRAREQPLYAKAALRLDGALARGWALTQGNHAATRDGVAIPPSLTFEDIALLHAPVRSAAQIAAKTVVGWMAYMAKDPAARAGTDGYQWRTLFDGVARGEPILPETVTAMALDYAQDAAEGDWRARTVADDPGWTYQRSHSTGAPSGPLALVARSWEQSLAQPPPALTLAAPAALSDAAPAASGAFAETWHWDNLFVDVPFARFLIERFRPASVLDVGCGIGAYVTLFAQHGAQARGVDGLPPSATALTAAEYRQHDLVAPLHLGGRFDLVLCLEVAEHLAASHSATLLDSILRHASTTVVFSAAEPGQPGNGHVNCRPLSYWLDQFRARGWLPDWPDSAGLRAVASLAWLRRNPVVLRPADQLAEDGTARLLAVAARPFAWYGQQPGIRASFLDEPAPPPGGGYG